jgi:hypothetical protein
MEIFNKQDSTLIKKTNIPSTKEYTPLNYKRILKEENEDTVFSESLKERLNNLNSFVKNLV